MKDVKQFVKDQYDENPARTVILGLIALIAVGAVVSTFVG